MQQENISLTTEKKPNAGISLQTQFKITNLIIECLNVQSHKRTIPLTEIVNWCKSIDKQLDENDILEVCKWIPFSKTYITDTGELYGLRIME